MPAELADMPAETPRTSPYVCVVFPDAKEKTEADMRADLPWPQRIVWPCRKGQLLAALMPPGEGPPDVGTGVGVPLESLKLGRHVAWNAEHTAVIAMETGRYLLRRDQLEVETEWTLHEDLDATGGSIDFPGPVHLHKNVLDLVQLSAEGDIMVHGSVEAATLKSRANITIHHGVCGKSHGVIAADGNITLRFASNARVYAGGDIVVGNEINNSDLFSHARILAEHAALISGHAAAVSKLCCETAGSDSGMRMLLELGLPQEVLATIEPVLTELKSLRLRSEHIRASIEPLMQNAKRLTNAQKEKATELLCMAAELEQKAAELTKSLAAPLQQLEQVMTGVVEIRSRVYPDVTIVIAGLQTTFQKEQAGPIKIMRRDLPGMPQLVAIDGHNRATVLHTTATPMLTLLQTLRAAAHAKV